MASMTLFWSFPASVQGPWWCSAGPAPSDRYPAWSSGYRGNQQGHFQDKATGSDCRSLGPSAFEEDWTGTSIKSR